MLSTTTVLRHANAADWSAVASLLSANNLPLDGAQDHLSNYLLACRGADVVGVAGAEVYGNIALLRSIAVAPMVHGQGVGRMLVLRLLEEAKMHRMTEVYLLTTTATQYFSQFGFQRCSHDCAPPALQSSVQFQGACPASAHFMSLALVSKQPTTSRTVAQPSP